MQFVADGYLTTELAQEVGSAIKYLWEHPEDTRHAVLTIERYIPTEAGLSRVHQRHTLLYRPSDDIIVLANGQELVRSFTKSGHRLDILFGDRLERGLEPCFVFIDPDAIEQLTPVTQDETDPQ